MYKLEFNKNVCLIVLVLSYLAQAQANPLNILEKNVSTPIPRLSKNMTIAPENQQQLTINDLALVQQKILHQEFLKKWTQSQQLATNSSVSQEAHAKTELPLSLMTEKKNVQKTIAQLPQKALSDSHPKQLIQVLAIYGPSHQPTAEIAINGQHHAVSQPIQIGRFRLSSIDPDKIDILISTTEPPTLHLSSLPKLPAIALRIGQQIEVQP